MKKPVMDKLPLTLFMEHGPWEGKSFPATHLNKVTVGRTRTNKYPIKDPTISQKHAFINWRVDHWELVDVGSSNGTDVNGKVLVENEPVRLRNGDLIRFGESVQVRVQIEEEKEDEEEEEAKHKEVEEKEEEEEAKDKEVEEVKPKEVEAVKAKVVEEGIEQGKEEDKKEGEQDEDEEEQGEEDKLEEQGISVEEWFEQERLRIVGAIHGRAGVTILEMKQNAEELKKRFREHAGID